MNRITPAASARSNVQYVRFTILSNQNPADDFADVSELAVHGIRVGREIVRIGGGNVVQFKKTTTFTTDGSRGPDGSPSSARRGSGRARPATRGPSGSEARSWARGSA